MLIGDDGQHDEEIYGEFALDHPEHVRAIAIRQLSTSEAVLAGGRSKLDQLPAEAATPWIFAPDGAGLSDGISQLEK